MVRQSIMAVGACRGDAVHLMADRKKIAWKGGDNQHNLQSQVPRDLLPPSRSDLLVSITKIAMAPRDQMFNT
jgi:hypothetical protein